MFTEATDCPKHWTAGLKMTSPPPSSNSESQSYGMLELQETSEVIRFKNTILYCLQNQQKDDDDRMQYPLLFNSHSAFMVFSRYWVIFLKIVLYILLFPELNFKFLT